MTVRELIKELKKYRKSNPGVIFMSDKYDFYETTNLKDIKASADMYDTVKFTNDEYTNTDGTRGWWLQIWIKKVKELATR